MTVNHSDLSLLDDPVAQRLLNSTHPAHLAYVWPDGTPRVVPIWFHWNGHELVVGSPSRAPKFLALPHNSHVAVEIDDEAWPYKVLLIRGTARFEIVQGVAEEYKLAAQRYFGEEQGTAWAAQMGTLAPEMGRIVIRPEWVGILDFETRFPQAVEKAMASGAR